MRHSIFFIFRSLPILFELTLFTNMSVHFIECFNFVMTFHYILQVDVIVNNTSKDLNLSNGLVSQSLLNAAGNSLQEEVRSKYPKGLEGFKVAVSEGHNLKCKAILHTSIPQCNRKDTDQCKQVKSKSG